MTGDAMAARAAVTHARALFVEAGDLGFGAALCDYFEGEAATFGRDYAAAETLLQAALRSFEEFGQDHFLARAEAAIGNILASRGQQEEALEYFARAVAHFDPEKTRALSR